MLPITQYWHDGRPPDEVATLIESFRRQNSDMHHMLFSEGSGAEFIARHFTSQEVLAFRACRVPAMQADYLRYCAVLHHGGVYADADLRCIGPLSSLSKKSKGGILFGLAQLPRPWRVQRFEWRERVDPFRIILNGIFAFPAGHPLLELSVKVATANVENRIAEDVSLVTGPGVFTCLYLLHKLGSFDAFQSYAQGGVIEISAPLLCEVVGDYRRIEQAFAGVRLAPVAESRAWAKPPQRPLAYKEGSLHWVNFRSSIFR